MNLQNPIHILVVDDDPTHLTALKTIIKRFGKTCQYGGPSRWMPPEEVDNFNEVTPDMFQNFEDNPEVVKRAKEIGRRLDNL